MERTLWRLQLRASGFFNNQTRSGRLQSPRLYASWLLREHRPDHSLVPQDLRLQENAALHAALAKRGPIVPVYIFDEAGEGAWPAGGVTRWLLHHLLAAFKVKDCSGSGQARKRWSVE